MSEFQYALWWEDGECVMQVAVFNTEDQAASQAASIQEYTDGIIFGLQRSDGALEPASTWPAYEVALEKLRNQEFTPVVGKIVAQKWIYCPFAPGEKTYSTWVSPNTPSWVGAGEVE